MRFLSIALIPLILLGGCAGRGAPEAAAAEPAAADWRKVATVGDRKRIREWRTAFTAALANARAGGHGAEIAREGALLDPDAAITATRIPAGDYRCRVLKLGANGDAMGEFTAYPSFACRIGDEGDVASFTKTSGSQRPVGLIFAHDAHRQIFLGTMMLGDERRALDYGRDAERDMAGAIEMIGPKRWRMILPWPRFESMLDVIELVPASA